jgi:hypothetical protein
VRIVSVGHTLKAPERVRGDAVLVELPEARRDLVGVDLGQRVAAAHRASDATEAQAGLDRGGLFEAELLDRALAQLVLLHLAGDGHRELVDGLRRSAGP